MQIKLYKCDCEHAIFPFGSGAPVCMRVMEETKDRKDLYQCVEKGCKHYKSKGSVDSVAYSVSLDSGIV